MSRTRVLLADDHRMVAEGIRNLLEDRFEVVDVVEDGRALLEAARKLVPDVVVADIGMPVVNGIEATIRLKQEQPGIKVVILTMHREEAYARRALEVGASAFVLKAAAPSELVEAIEAALAGKTFVTPELEGGLAQALRRGAGKPHDEALPITRRQREILQLLAAGKTAKEIGAVLGISARTVESHKYELMQALGVERSAELVRYAVKRGLVEG
ncbi:MAG TPA: response regulator transcription factor [Thermoanaerobaculales bacterium]|nr:response regulator transcription factor [Thermoanaerobaculales bacterium]HQN95150.1 response regulator transcription factor [Thermoanaerobaculales bacterium]HQP44302.1 response regulator transcription factor [Thermoanaerobaculales bacterium]